MKNTLAILFFLLSIATFGQQTFNHTIYFDFDKSEISKEQASQFGQEIRSVLLNKKILKIEIAGHTDTTSSDSYNIALADKRIQSVLELMDDLDFDSNKIKTINYGRKQPVNRNSNETNRAKNRRVEISVDYDSFGSFGLSLGNGDGLSFDELEEEKPFENDTIIYGKKGVILEIEAGSFYPKKIADLEIEMTEVLDVPAMIRNGVATKDVDGNCLSSGGMVFARGTIDGSEVVPSKPMILRIPADEINKDMKVYDMVVIDGDTLWELTEIPMKLNFERGYYEVDISKFPNINIDMLTAPSEIVLSPIGKFMKKWKEEGIVVKTRRNRWNDSYLVVLESNTNIEGEIFKPKKSRFESCSWSAENSVVAMTERKGLQYIATKQFSEMKYKRFFNRYIIKKKDFRLLDRPNLELQLEEMLTSL